MLTRCPHCLTLFRIHEPQLSAASGQVRCCCCDNIFNAKKNLQQNSGAGEQGEPIEASQDESPDHADDRPAEAQPVSDGTPDLLPRPDRSDTHEPDGGPEDIPAPTPPPWAGDPPEQPLPRAPRTIAWSLAVLALLVVALGQIGWFSRERLAGHPEVRPLLQRICEYLDCRLPPWREPGRLNIVSRSVTPHPETAEALQVLLVFDNRARYPQPYPQLQFELYDQNGTLTARRRLTPAEYIGTTASDRSLLQPGQSVSLDLALKDPGKEVIGFKIDFL